MIRMKYVKSSLRIILLLLVVMSFTGCAQLHNKNAKRAAKTYIQNKYGIEANPSNVEFVSGIYYVTMMDGDKELAHFKNDYYFKYYGKRNGSHYFSTKANILADSEELYNDKPADYAISNFPIYGLDKNLLETKHLQKYIDHKFEDMQAMIFKDYDIILTTAFGDYMTPPPEDQRIPRHTMTAYWKTINCC